MTDLGWAAAAAAAAAACLGTCMHLCMRAKAAVCSGAALVDNSAHARCVRLMSRAQINTSRSRPRFVVAAHREGRGQKAQGPGKAGQTEKTRKVKK